MRYARALPVVSRRRRPAMRPRPAPHPSAAASQQALLHPWPPRADHGRKRPPRPAAGERAPELTGGRVHSRPFAAALTSRRSSTSRRHTTRMSAGWCRRGAPEQRRDRLKLPTAPRACLHSRGTGQQLMQRDAPCASSFRGPAPPQRLGAAVLANGLSASVGRCATAQHTSAPGRTTRLAGMRGEAVSVLRPCSATPASYGKSTSRAPEPAVHPTVTTPGGGPPGSRPPRACGGERGAAGRDKRIRARAADARGEVSDLDAEASRLRTAARHVSGCLPGARARVSRR